MTKEELKERFDHARENPGTLFGFIYPYILVVILGVGLYYLPNIAMVAQQNVPPSTLEVPEVADLNIQQPKLVPPVDLKKISKLAAELLEKGKKLYTINCTSCHGETGTGTGPGSIGLNPAPRNFTVHEGWKNGETLSGIYTSIEEGLEGSSMVAYDFLMPEEKFALAHYIRTEFITDPPEVNETELKTLDALHNLSAGTQQPGQIPTETSMEIIAGEYQENKQVIISTVEKINQDESEAGKLFVDVTNDLHLALSALSNSDNWRGSVDSFKKFLTSNMNQNGFNGGLFSLSQNEWNSLYQYCAGLL